MHMLRLNTSVILRCLFEALDQLLSHPRTQCPHPSTLALQLEQDQYIREEAELLFSLRHTNR